VVIIFTAIIFIVLHLLNIVWGFLLPLAISVIFLAIYYRKSRPVQFYRPVQNFKNNWFIITNLALYVLQRYLSIDKYSSDLILPYLFDNKKLDSLAINYFSSALPINILVMVSVAMAIYLVLFIKNVSKHYRLTLWKMVLSIIGIKLIYIFSHTYSDIFINWLYFDKEPSFISFILKYFFKDFNP